jgi:hypothetical protein
MGVGKRQQEIRGDYRSVPVGPICRSGLHGRARENRKG